MINSQKTLEFDKIKKLLADACPTKGAAEMAERLQPYYERDDVIKKQNETEAAKSLSLIKGMPSFFHVEDVSPICDAADKSATLSPADLLTVASHLKCAAGLVEYIRENKQFDTVLDEIFERLVTNRRLEERITRSIISVDLIADDASPALADIRRSLKRAASNIRESLQKYTSGTYSKYLQENIVTMRGGRYVIPVKAEYRNEIKGLLHDTSASGATLFIEPASVVEANNAIRELESREKFEIDRILAELSANVSVFSSELRRNYQNITYLAFAFGCGELSCRMNAISPRISEGRELHLINARHPLLDPATTVPVTIELGDEYRMMVITGPNTGGKTVSLKTTGLFPMMAQAGLHIPCREGSVVPIFDNIFADIGDEQSIEQSLSTFSAHMAGIVSIMDKVTPDSLVLFDELGAGTDPIEGAALAEAILERVLNVGALSAATTHYAELKAFALETEGVTNASCEFDVKTLRPTYKLMIGTPGKSNAFAISDRLGLHESIIKRAGQLVDAENRQFESVIEKLDTLRFELEHEKEKIAAERAEMQRELREAEDRSRRITEQAERIQTDAEKRAKQIVDGARASAEYVFAELERVKKEQEKKNFGQTLANAKKDVRGAIRKADDEVNPVYEDDEDYVLPRALKAGDNVIHRVMGTKGVLTSDPDKKGNCMVQMGNMKTRINIDKLRLDEGAKPEKKKDPHAAYSAKVSRDFKATCDVRGMTGDDGWFVVDKYLDEAQVAHVKSVTILHGKGTGALRKALWNYFKSDRRIESFRAGQYGEGDYGVTIVELK